jgi:predicted PurR-regulated permease PerM
VAQFLRRHFEGNPSDNAAWMDRLFTTLISVPTDLGTALLLSLFICIDFPRLKEGMSSLRGTWLREVYEEIAGTLGSLGHLIGRALYAQGLIALCNAVLMFVGLTLIGVDHEVLLSVATFILCLIPTLGAALAWALIAVCALLQPGGGLLLALKATGVTLVVVLMEILVFGPRILGRMMELHPVLIIALLPVAQYFFGIWGLVLATPVAVYVVHVVILRRGLPGMETPKQETPAGPAAAPSPPPAADGEPKAPTSASAQP